MNIKRKMEDFIEITDKIMYEITNVLLALSIVIVTVLTIASTISAIIK